MEIEISDAADAQEIAEKLQRIYALLERSIDQQIRAASRSLAQSCSRQPFLGPNRGGNGHDGNSQGFQRNGHASPAQIRMIFTLCKDRNISREDLLKLIQAEFNAGRVETLSKKQASDLIDKLRRLEGVPG